MDRITNELSSALGESSTDEDAWLVSVGDVLTNRASPPEFLTEHLMPAAEVTLLAAHGGTGKSLLMLMWAVHAALGRRFIGKQMTQAPTIFYSAEDPKDIIRYRLAKICDALQIDPAVVAHFLHIVDATREPLLFIEGYDPELHSRYTTTTTTYTKLQKLGARVGARYFFIDNASDTFAADENKRAQVGAFVRSLRLLGFDRRAGVVLAAHVDKRTARGEGGGESYSGSSQWHNSVRSRLFMEEIWEGSIPGLLLTQGKSNHGRKANAIRLTWNVDGLLEQIDPEESARIKEILGNARMNELLRVIDALTVENVNIPTATSGPRTVHHVLASHPQYPRNMKSNETNSLILQAERAKKIRRDSYLTEQRKPGARWMRA